MVSGGKGGLGGGDTKTLSAVASPVAALVLATSAAKCAGSEALSATISLKDAPPAQLLLASQ